MSTAASAATTAATALASLAPIAAALVTAAIAALVAWFTARRTVHLEAEKLRLGTQQKILEMLIEARLEAYPEVSALLSNLWKEPPQKAEAKESFQAFLRVFSSWDSRYALLLGPETTNVCYSFRQVIVEAVRTLELGPIDDHVYDRLIEKVFAFGQELELALRSDIGIYGFHLAGPDGFQTPIPDRW